MPSGLKRFQNSESLHFITFSCFHRLAYLDAPSAKETLEAVLEQARARHLARVYAYVLTPEHDRETIRCEKPAAEAGDARRLDSGA